MMRLARNVLDCMYAVMVIAGPLGLCRFCAKLQEADTCAVVAR